MFKKKNTELEEAGKCSDLAKKFVDHVEMFK